MTESTVALGEVVDVLSGFAFKSKQFSDDGDLPVVRIRDVTRGYSKTYYVGGYDERFVIFDGDVLIGMDGEFNRARWRGGRALLNQRVCKVTPKNERLDGNYLYHFLPAALKTIERETPFVTVKHLSASKLKAVQLPLPSIEEQRRIAAVLDAADGLRTKRREALAKLGKLAQAIFLDIFGPGVGPQAANNVAVASRSGYPVRSLGDVVDFLDHRRRPITASNRLPGPVPYYGANGQQDSVADHLFDEPLVLLAEDGGHFDQPQRGIAYAISGKSWVNNHAHVLRPRDDISIGFLEAYLKHQDVTRYLTGSTRAKLTKSGASSILVPIPPREEQGRFDEARQQLGGLRSSSTNSQAALDDLFAAVQQRAFQGEL